VADDDAEEAAEDGEVTADDEVVADGEDDEVTADGEDDEVTADGEDDEVVAEGDPGGGWRRWWVVGGVAAVVVIGLVVGLVLRSGDGDEDSAAPDATRTTEPDSNEADGTTVPSSGPPADLQEQVPALSGLEPVDGDPWQPDDVGIGGTTHGDTLVSEPIGGCEDGATRVVTYDLGGRYTRLDGTLGLADDSAPGVTVEITFSLDGAEVYWRSFVAGESSRIQLDLAGARQLTITAARVFGGDVAPDACARAAHGDLSLS